MKEFACGDIVPGCVAKFKASSDQEILEQVAEHARHDHGMTSVSPELAESVQRLIHDAAAPG